MCGTETLKRAMKLWFPNKEEQEEKAEIERKKKFVFDNNRVLNDLFDRTIRITRESFVHQHTHTVHKKVISK